MPAPRFVFKFSVLSLFALSLLSASCRARNVAQSATFSDFPNITLWAWESREELRSIDSRRYGVAYLAATITIDNAVVRVTPRHQPLRVPAKAKVIAVVRVEAPGAKLDAGDDRMVEEVANAIVKTTLHPEVAALQIDFDATVSQRDFYRRLLSKVREQMPRNMPLSMTALASWCAGDDWIAGLPVDEAVPMYFRMGRDAIPNVKPGWSYPIHEPLCETSAGVSMDEPWPSLPKGIRIYVFHPTAWNEIAFGNLKQVEP